MAAVAPAPKGSPRPADKEAAFASFRSSVGVKLNQAFENAKVNLRESKSRARDAAVKVKQSSIAFVVCGQVNHRAVRASTGRLGW